MMDYTQSLRAQIRPRHRSSGLVEILDKVNVTLLALFIEHIARWVLEVGG
jgi:hypothetical protein